MDIVRRSRYLDRLITFQDTDLIKIVTGIRRCGKSTLLDMMRNHLAQQGASRALLTFKMESLEYAGITDYLTFYRMVRERIDGIDHPYLFFDELQNVEGWEKAVNSLRVDLPCDIYVTGSNAFLLSSELATLISGRYVEVKMQPLTFSEYLDFRSIDAVAAEGLGERVELVSRRAIALIQIPCLSST
ncbi:MAG: ATP-binding protein [Collinsella sp.]